MRNSVVTVICVNRYQTCWPAGLTDDVVEQDLGLCAVVCRSVLFAVYFIGEEFIFSNLLEHSFPVYDLVGGIEISFHEKDGVQLCDKCASKDLSSITKRPCAHRSSIIPLFAINVAARVWRYVIWSDRRPAL